MRLRRSPGSGLVAIGSAIAAVVFTFPASALALQPGVHVNPNSPAGIEYAFPLASTRSTLNGQSLDPTAASTSSAPLFGLGIHPEAIASAGKRARGRKRTSSARARLAAEVKGRQLATVGAGGSLGGLTVALVGGVLLIGIAGGTLGSWLRRRATDS